MYHKYTLSSLQKKLNTFFVYIVDTNETELETELNRTNRTNRIETELNGTLCLLSVSLSGG
jgi:hypothetical protein